MNKLILTLLAVGFMATACYASQAGTYNVDSNGCVTKGAQKTAYTKSSIVIDKGVIDATSNNFLPKTQVMFLR